MAEQDRNQGGNQGGNTSNRGFASMDDDKQRDIASKGGQSVPAEERSFSKDRELASEAGRKGGENSQGGQNGGDNGDNGGNSDNSGGGSSEQRGGSGNFAQDRERASEAGRKGGEQSSGGR